MQRLDAIYARQSVDKKDSVSIETQIDECARFCKGKYKVYSDKGYTGKNTNRPDLQNLLNDVEAGLIGRIVVYKLDRVSRKIADFHNLYDFMQTHDCDFYSVTEAFDTSTSMGRAMMSILAVFAQMERENIGTRVKDNIDYRMQQGYWGMGKNPFGYTSKKKDGGVTLIPIRHEMKIVKEIFDKYMSDANVSIRSLQRYATDKGYKTKTGSVITTGRIRLILSNPIYAEADSILYNFLSSKKCDIRNDKKEYNKKRCAFRLRDNRVFLLNGTQALITSRQFVAVQERLSQNQCLSQDNKPTNKLQELSGLIKCAKCGHAIKTYRLPTLSCTGKTVFMSCDVKFKSLRLETIQRNVSVLVQKKLDTLEDTYKAKRKKYEQEEKKIIELQKKLDHLIRIAEYSDNAGDAVSKRIDKLQTEIYDRQISLSLNIDRRDLIEERTGISDMFFGNHGKKKATLQYKDLDTDKKQAVLRVLVKRILVQTNGDVKIDWQDAYQ